MLGLSGLVVPQPIPTAVLSLTADAGLTMIPASPLWLAVLDFVPLLMPKDPPFSEKHSHKGQLILYECTLACGWSERPVTFLDGEEELSRGNSGDGSATDEAVRRSHLVLPSIQRRAAA